MAQCFGGSPSHLTSSILLSGVLLLSKSNYVYIANQCVPGAVLCPGKHEPDVRCPLKPDPFFTKPFKA